MIHKKKILMLGNSHLVIFGFRGELIERFIAEGYDVTVAFPNGPFGEGEKTSREFGCKFIEIPMNRRGVNPIQELYLLWRYKVLIRKVQPDIVLAYTVKCDIYGGFACRTLGIPFIPNITGLGKGLAEGGLMRLITSTLYKFAMKNAACVFFQNQQDRQFFLDSNIPIGRNRVLPGSGVNLRKFKPLPYPESEPVVFTYIARVMKAKGIEQFLDAAKVIKTEFPDTEFHICGYCEENYKDVIARAEREGSIHYHGLEDNIIDYERMSHCIVLPTFHPEGISNVLLEAAACARPLITTNRAGCRETVEDGVTGYLIKERSSQDLIEKMRMFLALTYEQRKKMGEAGARKIRSEFDRKIVVDAYLQEIEQVLGAISRVGK